MTLAGGGILDVADFENARWSERPIGLQRWHLQAAELVRHEPVLDIGGGDGVFAQVLLERGFRDITVGDISSVAVEQARARGVDAHVLDVRQPSLLYEDGAFGTVTVLNLLEHLYNPVALLAECARIARNVVVVVPNFHYWKHRLAMLSGRIPFESKPRRGHVYWFTEQMLKEAIAQAGLEADEWRYMTALMGLPALWTMLGRTRPMLFASGYAVRCVSVRRTGRSQPLQESARA